MKEVIITIKDSALTSKVESLLAKGDVIISLTAPTTESPFPLWIWKDTVKLWVGDRWQNVGIVEGEISNNIRTGNGLIRLKE